MGNNQLSSLYSCHYPSSVSSRPETLFLTLNFYFDASETDDSPRFLLPPMPGLIPFLPTPPLPQSNRSSSSTFRARPVNNLSADRGPARGSSSQAPIELDSDSEPTEASGTQTATNTTSTTRLSQTQQQQPQNPEPFSRDWPGLAVESSQQRLPALPSFSDFTADLDFDFDYLNAVFGANPPHTPAREPDSDDFLSQLIDGQFSSPSSYPQSAQPSSVNRQTGSSRSQNSLSSLRPNRPAPTLPSNATPTAAAPRRGTPHPSFEVEESLFVSSDNEPEDYIMPVQTRRRASTTIISSSDQEADDTPPTSANRKRAAPSSGAARGTPAANKRRRTSQASTTRTRTPGALPAPAPKVEDDDDVFGDKLDSKGKEKEAKDDDIIDLAASNEVPPEMLIPKEDKRVKLSAFQCVICMDDVTALTVTHCGHLFCSECLHSALNVDATKNKCPICRQKVETKDRSEYNTRTRGFWPLELKLMTASRKGKQRA